jgi:hypothetical protein
VSPEALPVDGAGAASRGITGAQLARDKIDRYRPLGAFGKPAYQSHVQLRAMLLAKRGPKFANYFAKPTYDADSGELTWTSEVPGTARGWHEMNQEEQAQRALELEVVRSGLTSYAQELRAQGSSQPGGSQAFASLLEQALKVPAQGDFLYFIGDQPVIAFWGFETQGGGSVEPTALAPQYPLTPPPPAIVEMERAAAVAKRKRPWWWWLLWALLALLLLLAVLLGLRACTPPPVAPVEDRKAPVEEVKPPVEEVKPPVEEVKPSAEPPKPPVEEVKPPVEEVKPPVEDPKPKPKPPADKSGPPQTKGLKPGQDLQIPRGALEKGDLSFLEGLWQLGEGRLNEYKFRPEDIFATNRTVFQFRRDGKGQVYAVERRDARTGRPLPSMEGRLRVYTDGKRLFIERDNGSRHECEVKRDGRTQCSIVNSDGVRWDAPLRRLRE